MPWSGRPTVEWITQPDAWIGVLTLTALEIVLGIDNIVFISILTGRLPKEQQQKARTVGLGLALIGRVGLLFALTWIMGLVEPFFSVFGHSVSGRDLILLVGGLFLIYKATKEIHGRLEGEKETEGTGKQVSYASVMVQILLLDLVFSLDSVITAVGMVKHIGVMITAVLISVGVMMLSAGKISAFINQHPTVKMLALSFLLMIGMTLVAEGWGAHIEKGYVYSAMAFSIFVELLNMRVKAKSAPVRLRETVDV